MPGRNCSLSVINIEKFSSRYKQSRHLHPLLPIQLLFMNSYCFLRCSRDKQFRVGSIIVIKNRLYDLQNFTFDYNIACSTFIAMSFSNTQRRRQQLNISVICHSFSYIPTVIFIVSFFEIHSRNISLLITTILSHYQNIDSEFQEY